ncbi:MAG: glycosyltransferase, partial [Acidimicrobiia bacterium]
IAITKATIVIPTWNRQQLADRALASALAQTVTDLEVIVVDDGSEPPYRPSVVDQRVRMLRNDVSRGPSAARNAALATARGEWITFLDDDDLIVPEMLEISLRAGTESSLPGPVSVLSGAVIVDPEGTVLKTRMPPTLTKGRHFFLEDLPDGGSFQTHATLVAPTDVVRLIGGFDEELPASEHDDFFLRLNTASSIQGAPSVTYQITAHTGTRLSKAIRERAEGMEKTVDKHQAVFSRHPRRFARYLSTMGVTYLRAGEWGPAVRATTRSIRVDPRRADSYRWWLASLAGPWTLRLTRRLRHASPSPEA